MYYKEAISLLKLDSTRLKARRLCWVDAHITYNKDTCVISYTRRQEFEDGTIITSCYNFIPSHGDLTLDDWEIFE